MRDEKTRQIADIKEMLEEIEYIRRDFVNLSSYDALEVKRVNSLVSAVWLWFMTEYKTVTELTNLRCDSSIPLESKSDSTAEAKK